VAVRQVGQIPQQAGDTSTHRLRKGSSVRSL
jgi:hypothetical protein